MKYRFIQTHPEFSISTLCRCLQVSRSSYYHWLSQGKGENPSAEDQRLTSLIVDLFQQSRGTYGTRRLKRRLAALGKHVSRRRIGRLMKQAGLVCRTKRRFKVTTDSKHNEPISPNLLDRQFKGHKPNRCYVGDITYIPTETGWLYLAVVIDLYSRQVVGWAMANHMKASLVNDALCMALWRRKPDKGLLYHTDRGSQYASKNHRAILRDHHITQSMSRRGNCWDNAVVESFFHTLKVELIHLNRFRNQQEAKQQIFEYIEVFYNRQRLHSANNYLSPCDFERLPKTA